MKAQAKGGLILAIGGAALLCGYCLDPICASVTLEKVACVGTMGAGCAMIAAGALQIWWGYFDGRH